MDRAVEKATQALSEALTDACAEALMKAGFYPSQTLLDEIHEVIKNSIKLG